MNNLKLFRLLESQERLLHEKHGFSVETQKAFEPLYAYCNDKVYSEEDMKEFAIEVADYDQHSQPRKTIEEHLTDFTPLSPYSPLK